jgi:hypothetical protein
MKDLGIRAAGVSVGSAAEIEIASMPSWNTWK